MVISFMILFMFYFLIMGYLTILESKILGLIQSSLSVFKISFLGMYHFYLDFLKTLVKGFMKLENSKMFMCCNTLLLMILVMFLGFFMLMMNFFMKGFSPQMLMAFLILDGIILFLKFLMMNLLKSKFVGHTVFSIKNLYILMEAIFSYLILIMGVLLIFSGGLEVYCKDLSFVIIMSILLYLIILMKISSVPSDFFEVESELSGGVTLEISSWIFLLWLMVEYGMMLNNHLFLVYLLNNFMSLNLILNVLILTLMISTTLVISGLMVRFSINSNYFFMVLEYFLFNILMFVITLI